MKQAILLCQGSVVPTAKRFDQLVGESRALKEQLTALEEIAASNAPVSIHGETGTGKELVSRALHMYSDRADRKLLVQNCAAVADGLLQSLLFGHKRGAFTGAERDQIGIFEAADGGTLFLDEIGDMSLNLQASVLRAVDQGEIVRVGETQGRSVDVRVLSATHRDLQREIAEGRFREDLYYRLSTFEIVLPPLRHRDGDVSLLASHFLEIYNRSTKKGIPGFTPGALAHLERYVWPGNVRQLASEVERACVLTRRGEWIDVDVLSNAVRKDRTRVVGVTNHLSGTSRKALPEILQEVESTLLRQAMQRADGNKTHAAAFLGISRQRLSKRLQRFALDWRIGGSVEENRR